MWIDRQPARHMDGLVDLQIDIRIDGQVYKTLPDWTVLRPYCLKDIFLTTVQYKKVRSLFVQVKRKTFVQVHCGVSKFEDNKPSCSILQNCVCSNWQASYKQGVVVCWDTTWQEQFGFMFWLHSEHYVISRVLHISNLLCDRETQETTACSMEAHKCIPDAIGNNGL